MGMRSTEEQYRAWNNDKRHCEATLLIHGSKEISYKAQTVTIKNSDKLRSPIKLRTF